MSYQMFLLSGSTDTFSHQTGEAATTIDRKSGAGREKMPAGVNCLQVSVSTATLAVGLGRPYHDLRAALRVAAEMNLPALELVMLPEWNPRSSPVTPHGIQHGERVEVWKPEEIIGAVDSAGVDVLTVHASRDIGALLSGVGAGIREAQRQLEEAAEVAHALGVRLLVIHAWNTFADTLQVSRIEQQLLEAALRLRVCLAVENVPVSDPAWNPSRLAARLGRALAREDMGGITCDLNWSSFSDDLDDLVALAGLILNVHVHGRVRCGSGRLRVSPRFGGLDLSLAVQSLYRGGVRGPWTLELNAPKGREDITQAFEDLRGLLEGLSAN